MNLERYAKHEERPIFEVWNGMDLLETFDSIDEARAYIRSAKYSEEEDYDIVRDTIEVKVYDLPEQDRF